MNEEYPTTVYPYSISETEGRADCVMEIEADVLEERRKRTD